jgi:hypothetical protein
LRDDLQHIVQVHTGKGRSGGRPDRRFGRVRFSLRCRRRQRTSGSSHQGGPLSLQNLIRLLGKCALVHCPLRIDSVQLLGEFASEISGRGTFIAGLRLLKRDRLREESGGLLRPTFAAAGRRALAQRLRLCGRGRRGGVTAARRKNR